MNDYSNMRLLKFLSKTGYKKNSPDKNNPFNIIPSGNITMKDVEFPVFGVDNLGNKKVMQPGQDYKFPGSQVFEIPLAQDGKEFNYPTDKDGKYLNHTLLPETTVFANGNYPMYDQLSAEEKRLWDDKGPIGRNIRSKAEVGYRGMKDYDRIGHDVMNFIKDATPIGATARTIDNPMQTIKGPITTALDIGAFGLNAINPAGVPSKVLFNYGINPLTNEEYFKSENIQGAFDFAELAGVIGGVGVVNPFGKVPPRLPLPPRRANELNDAIRNATKEYVAKATSPKNYARAATLDKEKGTQYVKALDDLKKHYDETIINETELPLNIKLRKDPGDGSGGASGVKKEWDDKFNNEVDKIKANPNESFDLPYSSRDRYIHINDNTPIYDVPRIVNHEIKHHYTLGQDQRFYSGNYGDELQNMIKPLVTIGRENEELAERLMQPAFKNSKQSKYDYFSSPVELDAYVHTNLRDRMVQSGALKNHWDDVDESKIFHHIMNDYNPSTYFHILKDPQFIKNFNRGVYGGAGIGTILKNKTSENKESYKLGGDVTDQDFKNYKDYVFNDNKEYQKIYDKLNRLYYKEAKSKNMSIPNYILTNIIKD